jgi:hypothetical protein
LVTSNSTASMKEGIIMSGVSFAAAFLGTTRSFTSGSSDALTPMIELQQLETPADPEHGHAEEIPAPELSVEPGE